MRILLSTLTLFLLLTPTLVHAQNLQTDDYLRARITAISPVVASEGHESNMQFELISGSNVGQRIDLTLDDNALPGGISDLKVGDTMVLLSTMGPDGSRFEVVERYRIPALRWIALIFIALAIFFGRKKGLMSLVGLGLSLAVLIWYVVPQILGGANPLLVSLIGSGIIAVFSIYLSHGYSRRTTLALISTLFTLGLAVGFALLFVSLAKLTGSGTEEAVFLQVGQDMTLNLRGLLLGGIVIGALGVLDDITTGQTAAVDEIRKANPSLTFKELYARGLSVGREHIASLINTLVLAYAGASFPLLLMLTTNHTAPLWTIINNEFLAEEIIRTLVGSSTLILAVPISTFLAAKYLPPPLSRRERGFMASHPPSDPL